MERICTRKEGGGGNKKDDELTTETVEVSSEVLKDTCNPLDAKTLHCLLSYPLYEVWEQVGTRLHRVPDKDTEPVKTSRRLPGI